MIVRLVVFLVVYLGGGAALAWGGLSIFKRTERGRRWLETRKRRHQGLLNARRAGYKAKDLCGVCFGRIEPSTDFYDGHSWIHKRCHDRIEGEVEAATVRSLPKAQKERT